ncbi:MAG: AzlC family ABC transporter permease [Eggerthellaceae bacterium]|nr:AzlC family ABC transporter permease [Eggerthellaceae bacterium]
MISRSHITDAFHAAVPIMLGYVAIGIPCGILCNSIGLNALQVFLLSALFYSGAGQFMIPNMYLAASPLASILASVSLVNTRQMLYSASFAPECQNVSKRLAFFFAATVTDESYGVSTKKFEEGGWSVDRALFVNLFSQTSWALSNVVGVLVGSAVNIPLNIAAFAMTSIFICLLVTQKMTSANIVAIVLAMLGVYACKAVGLTGPAILVGALMGVAGAMAYAAARDRRIVAEARGVADAGADGRVGDADPNGEGQRLEASHCSGSSKSVTADAGAESERVRDEGGERL